jgi:hypothetical protein
MDSPHVEQAIVKRSCYKALSTADATQKKPTKKKESDNNYRPFQDAAPN